MNATRASVSAKWRETGWRVAAMYDSASLAAAGKTDAEAKTHYLRSYPDLGPTARRAFSEGFVTQRYRKG